MEDVLVLLICHITVLRPKATSLLSQCESLRGLEKRMCIVCLLAVLPLPREAEREENRCVTETKQLCV